MKLTPKQQLFVDQYLVDLNATQAAIKAGYSAKTAAEAGYENLRKPQIAAVINARMEERSKATGITAERVLQGIAKVIDRCEQAVEVRDNEGNPTGEWKFEANAALRGYELLGKHLKLFTDKVEVDVSDALADRLNKARGRGE